MQKYKVHKFKNGLTLITIPFKNHNSTYTRVYVRAGSRYENNKNNGMAHLIEHILLKKIINSSKSKIIDDPIIQDFYAETFNDLTVYSFKNYYKDTEKVINLLSNILTNNNFSNVDIKTEKYIIFEEIRNEKDEFLFLFNSRFKKIYYKDSPLENTVLGKVENIKKYTLKYIKDNFDYYYNPKNIILVISGRVNEDKINRIINKNFKFKTKKREKVKIKKFKYQGDSINFIQKKSNQLYFNLTYPVLVEKNTERIKWEVFRFAVRNYLYNTVRNKGLCYSFNVGISEFEDFFDFFIDADVSKIKVLKFYNSLKKEINDFKLNFKQADLDLVRESLIKNYKTNKDDSLFVAKEIGWQAIIFSIEEILNVDQIIEIIKKTNLKDIQNFYKELFKNKGTLFVMGNINEKDKKEVKRIWKKIYV